MNSAWCLFLSCLLHLSTAQAAVCTVTADADHTTYSITGVSDVNVPQCEWSWSTNEVLATHKPEKHELVTSKDIDTLNTSKCLDNVIYELNCVPQGHRMANCTTNCTLSALQRSQKDKEISHNTTEHNIDAVAVAVAVAAAVFLVLALCFLCYKYKHRISSKVKWFYTRVNRETDDVEAEIQ